LGCLLPTLYLITLRNSFVLLYHGLRYEVADQLVVGVSCNLRLLLICLLHILLKMRSIEFEKTNVVESSWLSDFEVFNGILAFSGILIPLLLIFGSFPNFYISFGFLVRRLILFFSSFSCGLVSGGKTRIFVRYARFYSSLLFEL
jgi:hypothetical protein